MLGVTDHTLRTEPALALETVVQDCFEWVVPTVHIVLSCEVMLWNALQNVRG